MINPPAVILAGGRATRMGGGDKGLRVVGGKRLIDHVLMRLRPQSGPIALNANGAADRFADLNLPVLSDSVEGFVGPLAGVVAGMEWAASLGAKSVLSVAADTPFFPQDLAMHLAQSAGPSGLALAASADENGKVWQHPTFGIWPVDLRDDLRAALDSGLRKIVHWTEKHNAATAEFASKPFDPFFNINTPEDIIIAEQYLAGQR